MKVMRLTLDEPVRLEQQRLAAIYKSVGEAQAEEIICRAMEELAMRLAVMERSYSAEDGPAVAKGARSLMAIADQIGMAAMSQVAADVAVCAERQDGAALAATLSRLMRISDRSLTAVWDTADLSG